MTTPYFRFRTGGYCAGGINYYLPDSTPGRLHERGTLTLTEGTKPDPQAIWWMVSPEKQLVIACLKLPRLIRRVFPVGRQREDDKTLSINLAKFFDVHALRSVSRIHADILFFQMGDTRYFLLDVIGRNGCVVNDVLIPAGNQKLLVNGDVVQFGKQRSVHLTYRDKH